MRILIPLLLALSPLPASAAQIHDRPALWKVSDADTTIWLFGTIHLLKPEHVWLEGKVAKAFASAQELTIETRIPDAATAQEVILRHAIDPAGKTLASKLPAELQTRLLAKLATFGMPPELIKNAEPWYASMMVQILAYQKLGMSADGGVDVTLMARAEQAHQKIVPLEGFEEQIGFFDAMPEPLQIALLKATLDEVDGSAVVLDKMVKAWSKGDVGALAKLINEDLEQFAELRAILLDQRNAHWADWIAKRLDTPGTVFLAVGAGHLGGKNNVRALLEAKGFKVERVQ